jgi:hypothetical protein
MIHTLYMSGGPTFHHLMFLINLPLDKMSHSAELPANVVKSNDGYRAQVMALHKPIYSKTYRTVAEAAMRVPILVDIRNVFNKRQVDPTPSRGQIREICDKLHAQDLSEEVLIMMLNLDDRPISGDGSICSEDFDDSISNIAQPYDEANESICNHPCLTGGGNSVKAPIPYPRSLDSVIINRLGMISEMLTCLVNELHDLPRDVYGHTYPQEKTLPEFSRHMGVRHDMLRKLDVDSHKVHSAPIKRSRFPREALSEKHFNRPRVDNGTMNDLAQYVLRE